MKPKPDPIIKNISTPLKFCDFDMDREHHSLWEGILEDTMQALGEGTGFHWVGADEGRILFLADIWNERNTSLVSGADGATSYLQVTATYTAPEATSITQLLLQATSGGRVATAVWSTEAVSQDLANGQDYIINWTIHADI